jgi:hypothetical protein
MAETNNFYKINGVIYAKPVRKVEGKKGTKTEGQTFEFSSIILEVKRVYKDKTYTELPEFELGKGVNIDDFAIGDKVDVFFSCGGKKISDTFHKTSLKAAYLKHSDIQGNDTQEVGGKTPREINKKEETFVVPNPYNGNDDESDLPF